MTDPTMNEAEQRNATMTAVLPPARVEAVVRRWRFRVEDEDGTGRYVGPNGEPDSDSEWIGTDAEAARESDRRADAWENRPGSGWALRVVYESQGQVKANSASGQPRLAQEKP